MRNRALCLMVVAFLAFLSCTHALAGDWSVSALTDTGTSMIEARVETVIDQNWRVGLLATYFPDDAQEPSKDWGVGGYTKLIVDPNASIPVANWLPKVGDWLNLPETLAVETYLIGKGEVLPYDGGVDLALSVGGGGQIGPVFAEYIYQIIESGGADNPLLYSGPVLWLGLMWEF